MEQIVSIQTNNKMRKISQGNGKVKIIWTL
jgi:hypothetical protein